MEIVGKALILAYTDDIAIMLGRQEINQTTYDL